MPKIAWSTPVSHANDADFRAWGSELSARFGTAGLVQAADTGQMNWTTATKPSTGALAGFEIWRFADALQASAPVFLRIEYGTGGNNGVPQLRVTMGTGTNGAGTLTGVVTSQRAMYPGASALVANAATTNFQSYATHSAGFFGLVLKIGATNASGLSLAGFTVQRSASNAGVPTAEAVTMITCGIASTETGAADVSQINYPSSSVSNAANGYDLAVIPGRITASIVGLRPQIFLTWFALPEVRPNVGTAVYIKAEIATGTEFDLALVGSSPRHYLTIGNGLRACAYHGVAATPLGTAMLWED